MSRILCHLAFYDAENPVPGSGSYWHCRPRNVSGETLDAFYSGFARQCRPMSWEDVRAGRVAGGLAKPVGNWAVAFRYGDGGRNAAGRPGRTVIVAAFVSGDHIPGMDLTPLFRCPEVETLLAQASQSCPTPVPEYMDFECDVGEARADPALLAQTVREGGAMIRGSAFLQRAVATFSSLPDNASWLVKVGADQSGDEFAEIISVADKPDPKPPPLRANPPNETAGHGKTKRGKFARALHESRKPIILAGTALLVVALMQMLPLAAPETADRNAEPQKPGKELQTLPGRQLPGIDPSPASPAISFPKPPQPPQGIIGNLRTRLGHFFTALKWFSLGFISGGVFVALLRLRRKDALQVPRQRDISGFKD